MLPEQIREQQKQNWNKFSSGWRKWDELTMEFLRPMGDEIIRLIHPDNDDLILDVASGTGEPGLTIAGRVRSGKVVLTDLAGDMLEVARENALARSINNIEIVVCDVCSLPFPDNYFDAISCRFGFMFFPDMLLAAQEMYRVLKPGGRLATSVWAAPDQNAWAAATLDVINSYLQLPKPPTGTPGLYRCAERGLVSGLLHQAGFSNITESEVRAKQKFGTIDVYWKYTTEVISSVVAALSTVDQEMKEKIRNEVYRSIGEKYPDKELSMDSGALVISGEK